MRAFKSGVGLSTPNRSVNAIGANASPKFSTFSPKNQPATQKVLASQKKCGIPYWYSNISAEVSRSLRYQYTSSVCAIQYRSIREYSGDREGIELDFDHPLPTKPAESPRQSSASAFLSGPIRLTKNFEDGSDLDPKKVLVPDTRKRPEVPQAPYEFVSKIGRLLQNEITELYIQHRQNKMLRPLEGYPTDLSPLEMLWKIYMEARRYEQPRLVALGPHYGSQLLALIRWHAESEVWLERADMVFDDWIWHINPDTTDQKEYFFAYELILKVYSKLRSVDGFERRIGELSTKFGRDAVMSDKEILNSCVICYARAGRPQKAENTLKKWSGYNLKLSQEVPEDLKEDDICVPSNLPIPGSDLYRNSWALREILNAYSKVGRLDDTQRIFDQIKHIRHFPGTHEMNSLLRATAKQSNLSINDAVKIYEDMKRRRIKPNKTTYNILIHMSLQRNMPSQAHKWMSEMKRHGFKPDTYTFTMTIIRHLSRGQWNEADNLLSEMGSKVIEPTSVTHWAFLQAKYIQNDIDKVMEQFRYLARLWLAGDYAAEPLLSQLKVKSPEKMFKITPHIATVVLQASLKNPTKWASELLLLIRVVAKDLSEPSAIADHLFSAVPRVEELVKRPGLDFFKKLRESPLFANPPDSREATDNAVFAELLEAFSEVTNADHSTSLAMLLHYAISNGRIDTAHGLLMAARNHTSDGYVTSMLIKTALHQRDTVTATKLAVSASNSPRTSTSSSLVHFTQILYHYTNERMLHQAQPLASKVFLLLEDRPDLVAYNALLDYYAECRDVLNLEKVWMRLNESGIQPDLISHNSRIKCYATIRGQHNKMANAFNDLLERDHLPNSKTVMPIIRSYCMSGNPTHAILFIEKAARLWRIQPDVTVMNFLIGSFGRIQVYHKSAFHIFNSMIIAWIQGDRAKLPKDPGEWDQFEKELDEYVSGNADPFKLASVSSNDDGGDKESTSGIKAKSQKLMSWLNDRRSWMTSRDKSSSGARGPSGDNEDPESSVNKIRAWTGKSSLINTMDAVIPSPNIDTFKEASKLVRKSPNCVYAVYIWWLFLVWSRSTTEIPDPGLFEPVIDTHKDLASQLRELQEADVVSGLVDRLCHHICEMIDVENPHQDAWFSDRTHILPSLTAFDELGNAMLYNKVTSVVKQYYPEVTIKTHPSSRPLPIEVPEPLLGPY